MDHLLDIPLTDTEGSPERQALVAILRDVSDIRDRTFGRGGVVSNIDAIATLRNIESLAMRALRGEHHS